MILPFHLVQPLAGKELITLHQQDLESSQLGPVNREDVAVLGGPQGELGDYLHGAEIEAGQIAADFIVQRAEGPDSVAELCKRWRERPGDVRQPAGLAQWRQL